MALVARIVEVDHLQETENGEVVDLSLQGRYFARVHYIESTQPTVVLLDHTFSFPDTTAEAEAQEAIISFGRKVRDARVRVNALKAYIGATIPIT